MWLREIRNLKNDTKGELRLPEMTNEALMFPSILVFFSWEPTTSLVWSISISHLTEKLAYRAKLESHISSILWSIRKFYTCNKLQKQTIIQSSFPCIYSNQAITPRLQFLSSKKFCWSQSLVIWKANWASADDLSWHHHCYIFSSMETLYTWLQETRIYLCTGFPCPATSNTISVQPFCYTPWPLAHLLHGGASFKPPTQMKQEISL